MGKTIWNKTKVLLGTPWGTHWEQGKKLKVLKPFVFEIFLLSPKVKKITKSFHTVQVGSPKNKGYVHQNLPSYLASSHIWLNLPVDHCHFGYIIKLNQKRKNIGTHKVANISLVCSDHSVEPSITLTFDLARVDFLQVSRGSHDS